MFSLEDFLRLPVVEGGILRTNRKIIGTVRIDSIAVIELPVENFVRPNELVLTTCMGCLEDIEKCLGLVADIHAAGAAGVVISVGRHIQKIPGKVIEYAEERKFPLIELPWEIRFSDVADAVTERIRAAQYSHVQCFERLQKKLLTHYVNGAGLQEAAGEIWRQLESETVITDQDGIIRGKGSGWKKTDEQDEVGQEKEGTACGQWPIGAQRIIYGHLQIKKSEQLNRRLEGNYELLERCVLSPLALWFDREQTIFETEMQHADYYLWRLISAENLEKEELIRQGTSLGYDLGRLYMCIVGEIHEGKESVSEQAGTSVIQDEQRKISHVKSVKRELLRAGKTLGKPVMAAYQEEQLIVFLAVGEVNPRKEVDAFLDKAENQMQRVNSKLAFTWGIGETLVKGDDFRRAFQDAVISLKTCRNQGKKGSRNLHHNPDTYRMLALLSGSKEVGECLERVMGKLTGSDGCGRTELARTFLTYVAYNRNVSRTARVLHLHRQSLLYRLRKLEELTELSLEQADDVFLLELCMRIWEQSQIAGGQTSGNR